MFDDIRKSPRFSPARFRRGWLLHRRTMWPCSHTCVKKIAFYHIAKYQFFYVTKERVLCNTVLGKQLLVYMWYSYFIYWYLTCSDQFMCYSPIREQWRCQWLYVEWDICCHTEDRASGAPVSADSWDSWCRVCQPVPPHESRRVEKLSHPQRHQQGGLAGDVRDQRGSYTSMLSKW